MQKLRKGRDFGVSPMKERKMIYVVIIIPPGIYAEGDIVFVFPFVYSFVSSFILPSHSWNYFKVLRKATRVEYISPATRSESIHIWTIGTLEGWLLSHDSSPQGPCPEVGLEDKN